MALFFPWVLSIMVWVSQQPATDFRSLRWGMNLKEVQAAEKTQPTLATDSTLLYRRIYFYSHPASLELAFIDTRLAGARYFFTERYARANQHWQDYEDIVRTIASRYGDPSADNWTWNVPLYKNRPDRYGDAVLMGHLGRSNVWETDRSIVTLEMSGSPKEGIQTVLSYADKGKSSF